MERDGPNSQWHHKNCLERRWADALALDLGDDQLLEPPDWAWYGLGQWL